MLKVTLLYILVLQPFRCLMGSVCTPEASSTCFRVYTGWNEWIKKRRQHLLYKRQKSSSICVFFFCLDFCTKLSELVFNLFFCLFIFSLLKRRVRRPQYLHKKRVLTSPLFSIPSYLALAFFVFFFLFLFFFFFFVSFSRFRKKKRERRRRFSSGRSADCSLAPPLSLLLTKRRANRVDLSLRLPRERERQA